jgi:hypothetical protein
VPVSIAKRKYMTFGTGIENFFPPPSSKTTIQCLPHPASLLFSKFFSKFFSVKIPATKESYACWRSSDGAAFKVAAKALLEKCLTDNGKAREPTFTERMAVLEKLKSMACFPPFRLTAKTEHQPFRQLYRNLVDPETITQHNQKKKERHHESYKHDPEYILKMQARNSQASNRNAKLKKEETRRRRASSRSRDRRGGGPNGSLDRREALRPLGAGLVHQCQCRPRQGQCSMCMHWNEKCDKPKVPVELSDPRSLVGHWQRGKKRQCRPSPQHLQPLSQPRRFRPRSPFSNSPPPPLSLSPPPPPPLPSPLTTP